MAAALAMMVPHTFWFVAVALVCLLLPIHCVSDASEVETIQFHVVRQSSLKRVTCTVPVNHCVDFLHVMDDIGLCAKQFVNNIHAVTLHKSYKRVKQLQDKPLIQELQDVTPILSCQQLFDVAGQTAFQQQRKKLLVLTGTFDIHQTIVMSRLEADTRPMVSNVRIELEEFHVLDQLAARVTITGLEKPPLGIALQLSTLTGWGNFGLNLFTELVIGRTNFTDAYTPLLLLPPKDDLPFAELFPKVKAELKQQEKLTAQFEELLRKYRMLVFNFPVIISLGNGFTTTDVVQGSPNIGIVFLEDTYISPAEKHSIESTTGVLVAGSQWLANVLTKGNRIAQSVETVLQGVPADIVFFKPRKPRNLFPGKFVIFSGGKLEYRKGQDIVVEAFRRFSQLHPDAVLLCSWHNFWTDLLQEITTAGYVTSVPSVTARGTLDVEGWLEREGIPREKVYAIRPVINHRLIQYMQEADVALFPNRCEGGTNLVAMEAMASGLPSVVSYNSGHMEVVNESYAFPLYIQRKPRDTQYEPRIRSTEGWGESDVGEILERLEYIYHHRESVQQKKLIWRRQIATLMEKIQPYFNRTNSIFIQQQDDGE